MKLSCDLCCVSHAPKNASRMDKPTSSRLQVDAALDATNLDRVARYVRRCTRRKESLQGTLPDVPLQGIVISLKDKFYENADALIGVTKTHTGDASAVYTFDLSQFENPPLF